MPTITSVSGFPRIGQHRELKKAIENYWKGMTPLEEMRKVAAELRASHWQAQKDAGITLIPSNDFSYYDQVLDTAILLGAIPQRYSALGFESPEETLFAMARGYQDERGDVTALPMKKWFTTNYHYLVPEVDPGTPFRLSSTKPFDEFTEALTQGIATKPVLIGPYTFFKLATDASNEPLVPTPELVGSLIATYVEIVRKFVTLGATWLQFDEPYLVLDKNDDDIAFFTSLYEPILNAREDGAKILLNTYFGHIADVYEAVQALGFDAVGLDLVEGKEGNLAVVEKNGVNPHTTLCAGVVNGRNIWRNNYADTLETLTRLRKHTENIAVNTACSLLHVPYTTADETDLAAEVTQHFAFAVEKLGELRDIAVLADPHTPEAEKEAILAQNVSLFAGNRVERDAQLAQRIADLTDANYVRTPARDERAVAQRAALCLPILPTTTIGSFPQTQEVRVARARFRRGEMSESDYHTFIAEQIISCLRAQENTGLDVLVHGEFERNDMVEYFGQHLNGFKFTKNAWVQSYGTRCVKPPIVWSDVSRAEPMTVEWSAFAQSNTDHPVKGMLTGPVTILNWSWPREDMSNEEQTTQLALAIRDEVLDLEATGIRVIQIDEAALREKLPLRKSDWHTKYLDWAIPAFRLVHSGVKPTTQIHTHMCYSEFNDIIRDIDAMDADVISFEASRGELVVLDAIEDAHFQTQVGPGVYDIHSPRIPTQVEIEGRIKEILAKIDVHQVWINPDCGLKTRGNAETWPSLEHVVAATRSLRESLS